MPRTWTPVSHAALRFAEALVKALAAEGRTLEQAQARIEELKEAERYILEVYVSTNDRARPQYCQLTS